MFEVQDSAKLRLHAKLATNELMNIHSSFSLFSCQVKKCRLVAYSYKLFFEVKGSFNWKGATDF